GDAAATSVFAQTAPGSPIHQADRDKAKDKLKEASARDYLEKHGLTTFMQFLMQSLMKDKPSDPYSFLQRQVTKRMMVNAPEITLLPEDSDLESLLTKLAMEAPVDISCEDLELLEREAAIAGEQLRKDNLLLKET
ncbi:unnamed protein product, partial [Polarella glacialis]